MANEILSHKHTYFSLNQHNILIYAVPLDSLIDFDNFDSSYLRNHSYTQLEIFLRLIYHRKLSFKPQFDSIREDHQTDEKKVLFADTLWNQHPRKPIKLSSYKTHIFFEKIEDTKRLKLIL